MTNLFSTVRCKLLVSVIVGVGAIGNVHADSAGTLVQAVNTFQNAKATGGAAMTVDAKGPVDITDAVELPGFAFQVYDIDIAKDKLTMKLVAALEKLQITQYDETTFDRYYFAFDKNVSQAEISSETDDNFSATVELIEPGTQVSTEGAFVDGMPKQFTFENGGMLITVGEGTDLTKISEAGGALTVRF
jgi:hypothetical protein